MNKKVRRHRRIEEETLYDHKYTQQTKQVNFSSFSGNCCYAIVKKEMENRSISQGFVETGLLVCNKTKYTTQ